MQRQQSLMESVQKLELFISCRSLADLDTFSVSDPFVKLFVKKSQNWFEFGRTELIWNNLNPNFAKTFIIDYFFEVQQHVKFEVHHHVASNQSRLIGSFQTTISAIAGSKEQVIVGDLMSDSNKHSGKIIIRADQVKSCNDDLVLQMSAEQVTETHFWFWHKVAPFLRIYRVRKDNPTPVLVYETEFQKGSSPKWNIIEQKAQKLCNGDYQMPLKVELWDNRTNGSHIYLGETQFSIDELKQNPKQRREFKDKKLNKVNGILKFETFKLIEKPSFMDYISGGIQLNLVLAIDFTASNQNANHVTSLHYRDPNGKLNQYQQAMVSVGEILVNYDYDKQVPVYGFGCKTRLPRFNSNETLHCFPLNGTPENPEVEGLNGIMDTYARALPQLLFDGPTYFGPILKETMKIATACRDQGSDNYFILLILTDGEIHDMQASVDAIIASSHLPLSIIIIGVGNADFQNMQKLDNDDLSMTDSNGKKSKRDLVQFVPFNEYKDNPELLAKNVLEELPDQLVEYMQLIGRKPNLVDQVNLNNYGFDNQQQQSLQPQQQQKDNVNQNSQYQYPSQQQGQQQYPSQVNQPYQVGQSLQAFGGGLAQNGFLNNFINPQNQPLNDTQRQQQQQQQRYGK